MDDDTWTRIFTSLKYRILEEYGCEEDKESCSEDKESCSEDTEADQE